IELQEKSSDVTTLLLLVENQRVDIDVSIHVGEAILELGRKFGIARADDVGNSVLLLRFHPSNALRMLTIASRYRLNSVAKRALEEIIDKDLSDFTPDDISAIAPDYFQRVVIATHARTRFNKFDFQSKAQDKNRRCPNWNCSDLRP